MKGAAQRKLGGKLALALIGYLFRRSAGKMSALLPGPGDTSRPQADAGRAPDGRLAKNLDKINTVAAASVRGLRILAIALAVVCALLSLILTAALFLADIFLKIS